MPDAGLILSALVTLVWLVTICLPWLPWRTREVLESETSNGRAFDLSDITVVIPARNEAAVIETTLLALAGQGQGLKIIVVDDESTDGTAEKVKALNLENLQVIPSKPLPKGWTGKLWAQQQGLQAVKTTITLLLDADIKLQPGILKSLKLKQRAEKLHFVSLMAEMRFCSFWEKLLMPAFIYFFKMLYPFALVNKPGHKIAAAAGGCILANTQCLHQIGAMAAIKDAVIDDCTLAKKIKAAGFKTWIGLTHAVVSQRPYESLTEIWDMVARTAYSQLFYSAILLLACTVIMPLMFIMPLFGLFVWSGMAQLLCFFSIVIMISAYIPTLRFYSLNIFWALTMPVIAGLYLSMTWTSAWRFWQGERSRWKGRVYQNS